MHRWAVVLAAVSLAGAAFMLLGASGPSPERVARANAVPDHAPAARGPVVTPTANVGRYLEARYRGDAPEAGYCATVTVASAFRDTALVLTHVERAASTSSTVVGKPGVAFQCATAWTLHTHPFGACFVSLSDIVEANREKRDGAIVQCGPREFRAWIVR